MSKSNKKKMMKKTEETRKTTKLKSQMNRNPTLKTTKITLIFDCQLALYILNKPSICWYSVCSPLLL